ncbi:MAG: hypothetical protein HOE69_01175 [Euryarchaeota archaeon]|nr:hypothetical protein [Euryarchaeota archaeon]
MPRRKYGRLRKAVELPPKDNCSRCRSGKFCPLPNHIGNNITPVKEWKGPTKISRRPAKKNK